MHFLFTSTGILKAVWNLTCIDDFTTLKTTHVGISRDMSHGTWIEVERLRPQ